MAMADAAASHTDVLDAVIILQRTGERSQAAQSCQVPPLPAPPAPSPMAPPAHPAGDRGVPQRFGHEVPEQCVGAQEAEANVGGFGEIPQPRRVGEIHGTWTPVHQRHDNLQA